MMEAVKLKAVEERMMSEGPWENGILKLSTAA
jgi:hypothetical protein